MSDAYPTGASFGVAPMAVVPETLSSSHVAVEESIPQSAVPAHLKGRLRDRLRARKPKQKLVDLGDGDVILVRGMDAYAVEGLNADGQLSRDDEDENRVPSITESQPRMLRAMCFDPEDGSKVFGTGEVIGQDEHGNPIYDGLSDYEINSMPMDVINRIMTAVNEVMGRTSEPGKDSPSTADTGSSSS